MIIANNKTLIFIFIISSTINGGIDTFVHNMGCELAPTCTRSYIMGHELIPACVAISWSNLMKLYVFQIDGKVRVYGIVLLFYTIVVVNGTWCVSRENPAPQTIQGRCEQGERSH